MITTQSMRRLEDLSEHFGVSKLALMEKAGKAVADWIIANKKIEDHTILVFCGAGNNGGDGFVAARWLSKKVFCIVLFFGEEDSLSPESAANLARMQENPRIGIIRKNNLTKGALDKLRKEMSGKKLILVDALVGTGMSGKVREPLSTAIRSFNSFKGFKVSVDVPSGINPDTGKAQNPAVRSPVVITFHDKKPGLKKQKKVVIAPIGIPQKAVDALREEHHLAIEKEMQSS